MKNVLKLAAVAFVITLASCQGTKPAGSSDSSSAAKVDSTAAKAAVAVDSTKKDSTKKVDSAKKDTAAKK